MSAVSQQISLQLFISARGGCGKTFLLNAILDAVRCKEDGGCIALAMASTGIAAQLLHLGRTLHSRLKAPLHPTKDSTLSITTQSSLGNLVKMAKLLLIDEATMLHRFQIEALDRSLQDIMNNQSSFGGKIIILAGDFRQCLPVIKWGNRAQVVQACLNKSPLWPCFEVESLNENMRVRAGGDPTLELFDAWTVKVGEGTSNDGEGTVKLSSDNISIINSNLVEKSMKEFCTKVFPDFERNVLNTKWLEGRCILAPTNKDVDCVNDMMEKMVPGTSVKLFSSDNLENYADIMRFNTEYLNTLCPNGFPRHTITLKPGMLIMLLRNICPKEGLCNGTKLIFLRSLHNKLLICKLPGTGETIMIPRIKFLPEQGTFPFDWSRRQFPVRVAFATTINKSQGQTLKHVGVWLNNPVFSHGQLYVACSRVGDPKALHFALIDKSASGDNHTENVVYKEVLLQK